MLYWVCSILLNCSSCFLLIVEESSNLLPSYKKKHAFFRNHNATFLNREALFIYPDTFLRNFIIISLLDIANLLYWGANFFNREAIFVSSEAIFLRNNAISFNLDAKMFSPEAFFFWENAISFNQNAFLNLENVFPKTKSVNSLQITRFSFSQTYKEISHDQIPL